MNGPRTLRLSRWPERCGVLSSTGSTRLRRCPRWTRARVHPIKGQPIVALGSHGHDNLMMFGVYAGSQWEPNPDPNDPMYPAVVAVDWDRAIYEVDAGEVRAILGGGPFPRSMKLITRAEHDALREHATTPVMFADA